MINRDTTSVGNKLHRIICRQLSSDLIKKRPTVDQPADRVPVRKSKYLRAPAYPRLRRHQVIEVVVLRPGPVASVDPPPRAKEQANHRAPSLFVIDYSPVFPQAPMFVPNSIHTEHEVSPVFVCAKKINLVRIHESTAVFDS
jgi:hypothetical protein